MTDIKRRKAPFVLLASLAIDDFAPAAQANAEDSFGVATTLEDTKEFFTAPLRWDTQDWLYFGGALVAIEAAHAFDTRVRDHFTGDARNALNGGQNKNSLRDAAPTVALIAGTGLYAAFIRDSDGYRETWALLEAGAFSGITAEALGYAAGRERPDATSSPNEWRRGSDSFPSVHVSAAFAVGTVFAESGNDEYRWLRRLVGYGVAGGTAFVRMKENVHWFSDTVAGAAIGIATARFVLNREYAETHGDIAFAPVEKGWQISYSVRTP